MTGDENSKKTSEEFLRNLDRMYYDSIDPFFYFVASETSRLGTIPTVKLALPDGSESANHDFLDNLLKSKEKIKATQDSLLRMYRYFAAETMIILILSSKPHDPAYRVTSTIRGEKLNRALREIGKGEIPTGFSFRINKKEPTFIQWLGQKVAGDPGFFNQRSIKSVANFIKSEATFASERGAINSFKHSRPVLYGPSIRISLAPVDCEENFLNDELSGVTWVEWREGSNWLSVNYASEEVDVESDRRAIFYSCLLIDLMKRIRLCELDGQKGKVSIPVPCDFQPIPPVRRQNARMKFTANEPRGGSK